MNLELELLDIKAPFGLRELEGKEMRRIQGIWFLSFGLTFEEGKDRIEREREGKDLLILLNYSFGLKWRKMKLN